MPIFQCLTGLKAGLQNVLIYSKNVLIRRSSGPAGNAFRNCQGTKDRCHPQDAAPPSSGVDHGHVCRLLLGGQMARAGTRGHARHPCRCRPSGHLTSSMQAPAAHTNAPDCVHTGDRQRHVQAALGSNTNREARQQALGRLPMRNGSRHGEAQHCESANACIYNIYHPAPVDERPPCAETFCGKVSHAHFISLYALHITQLATLLFLQHPPCRLCYDGVA
jgi:hypothetical protein